MKNEILLDDFQVSLESCIITSNLKIDYCIELQQFKQYNEQIGQEIENLYFEIWDIKNNQLLKKGQLQSKQIQYLSQCKYFYDNWVALLAQKGNAQVIVLFDFYQNKSQFFNKNLISLDSVSHDSLNLSIFNSSINEENLQTNTSVTKQQSQNIDENDKSEIMNEKQHFQYELFCYPKSNIILLCIKELIQQNLQLKQQELKLNFQTLKQDEPPLNGIQSIDQKTIELCLNRGNLENILVIENRNKCEIGIWNILDDIKNLKICSLPLQDYRIIHFLHIDPQNINNEQTKQYAIIVVKNIQTNIIQLMEIDINSSDCTVNNLIKMSMLKESTNNFRIIESSCAVLMKEGNQYLLILYKLNESQNYIVCFLLQFLGITQKVLKNQQIKLAKIIEKNKSKSLIESEFPVKKSIPMIITDKQLKKILKREQKQNKNKSIQQQEQNNETTEINQQISNMNISLLNFKTVLQLSHEDQQIKLIQIKQEYMRLIQTKKIQSNIDIENIEYSPQQQFAVILRNSFKINQKQISESESTLIKEEKQNFYIVSLFYMKEKKPIIPYVQLLFLQMCRQMQLNELLGKENVKIIYQMYFRNK